MELNLSKLQTSELLETRENINTELKRRESIETTVIRINELFSELYGLLNGEESVALIHSQTAEVLTTFKEAYHDYQGQDNIIMTPAMPFIYINNWG